MTLTNQDIAKRLREHASELARTGDNLYRVRAFRSLEEAAAASDALSVVTPTSTHFGLPQPFELP